MSEIERDVVRGLLARGWTALPDDGFGSLVGPFYEKSDGEKIRFCFPVKQKHQNLQGVVQGGALMTFADRVMGITARSTTESNRTATIQFNFQFLHAVHIGEVVEAVPAIVRGTRHLVFMNAELTVDDRIVGVGSGVWKRLASLSQS